MDYWNNSVIPLPLGFNMPSQNTSVVSWFNAIFRYANEHKGKNGAFEYREAFLLSPAEKEMPRGGWRELHEAAEVSVALRDASAAILRYCNNQPRDSFGNYAQAEHDNGEGNSSCDDQDIGDFDKCHDGVRYSTTTTIQNEEIYAGFQRDLSMAKAFSRNLANSQNKAGR